METWKYLTNNSVPVNPGLVWTGIWECLDNVEEKMPVNRPTKQQDVRLGWEAWTNEQSDKTIETLTHWHFSSAEQVVDLRIMHWLIHK